MLDARTKLSRREFLTLIGSASSVVMLGACTSQTPSTSTGVAPTATPNPPQPTPTEIPPIPTPLVVMEPGGFEMVLVEAGSFQMGSAGGAAQEQQVHLVNITTPFYASKHEVTFWQFDEFCDDTRKLEPDDGGWGRETRPVTGVNWYDAVEYCNWLSERDNLNPCYSSGGLATQCDFLASGYRLPTEAEWEYAARGGQRSQGYAYAGGNDPDGVAWYAENSGDKTHPVGQKAPNELGLCDLSGNLWEWCWDWHESDYYAVSPSNDPVGPDIPSSDRGNWGRNRVRRGGSWHEDADMLRIVYRSYDGPEYRALTNGFRIVRTA